MSYPFEIQIFMPFEQPSGYEPSLSRAHYQNVQTPVAVAVPVTANISWYWDVRSLPGCVENVLL